MAFTSKIKAICHRCHEIINPGDNVRWTRDEGLLLHFSCVTSNYKPVVDYFGRQVHQFAKEQKGD